MERAQIGVVGAVGRLGGMIAEKVSEAGFEIGAMSGRGAEARGLEICYHTVFDRPAMNRAIRALRILRRHLPRAY